MADKEFTQEVKDIHIISEQRTGRIKALAKVAWNGRPFSWNIRTIDREDGNKAMKGIALSDPEMHNLANTLIKLGFGYSDEIVEALKDRDDVEEKTIHDFEDIFSAEKKNTYSLKMVE